MNSNILSHSTFKQATLQQENASKDFPEVSAARKPSLTQPDPTAIEQVEGKLKALQAEIKEMQAMLHVGSWEFDPKTGRHLWSDEMYRLFGYEPRAVPPSLEEMLERVPADDHSILTQVLDQCLFFKSPIRWEHCILLPDGSERFVAVLCTPILDAADQVVLLKGTVKDVTEAQRIQREMEANRLFLQTILDASPYLIFLYDLIEQRNLFTSHEIAQHLGYSAIEVYEMGANLLEIVTHPDDFAIVQAHHACLLTIQDGEALEIEYRMRHADGDYRWMHSRDVIFQRQPNGAPLQILGTAQDITARKLAEQEIKATKEWLQVANLQLEQQILLVNEQALQLEYQKAELEVANEKLEQANQELETLAVTDGLTGLKNRRAFQERLTMEFDRSIRYRKKLSVLLMDVDKFKTFNDTFGHPAGDEILREVARTLQKHARGADFVARYGGEEFIVLLPETDEEQALIAGERLRVAIATHEWPLRAITLSVGVSTLHSEKITQGQLVEAADQALYLSKQQGRNRVTHSDHSLPLAA